MKYPKYKLAFPGNHAIVFKGHPMTQFNGYTLGTYASGNGIVSANKTKGFWGESAQLFQSAAQYHTFDGYSANKGTINGNTYIFGKGDDIVTAFFDETEIYNLFLNQTQGGTITGNPMTGHSGQYIVLSALPSSHYTFNGYSVTGGVLSGDKIIIGNSDMTAQASWVEDPKYNLTITQTNGGKVTANKSTGYQGDQVTLSNTPSSHYTFNSYSITGATLTGNKFNFGNQNVTAKGTFVEDPKRTITLTQQTGGTITANPMTGYDGTVVTLSNTANAGYTFNSYSITGGTLTGSRFTLLGNDVTVKPNYTHNVYNLTLQTDGHGKLVAGKTTGYYNDTTTLTTTPSSNYIFNNYSVTGGTITNNVFKWGTSNATAKANFTSTGLPPMSANTLRVKMKDGTVPKNNGTGYTIVKTQISTSPNLWDLSVVGTLPNYVTMGHILGSDYNLLEIVSGNVSNVYDMSELAYNCSALSSVNLPDISNVQYFRQAFMRCKNLVSVTLGNPTNKIKETEDMFYECYKLSSAPWLVLDNVTNTKNMFHGCNFVTVPNYNLTNVSCMSGMFSYCDKVTAFPAFNLNNVTDMTFAFSDCYNLKSIPAFSVNKVSSCWATFQGCSKVDTGIVSMYNRLNVCNPSNHNSCFGNCGVSSRTGSAELAQIPNGWK